MKRLLFALAFVAVPLFGADVNNPELRSYLERSFVRCPGNKIRITTVDRSAPKGFNIYGVEQTSTDERCGARTYLLHSPTSGQVILGNVFDMQPGIEPLASRLGTLASQLLRKPAKVEIEPYSIPDGLTSVRVVRTTPQGDLRYQAYVDSGATVFIVGRRGFLKTDPRDTFLAGIGAKNAATRGNATAKLKILELSDYQCPTCARAHEVVEKFFAKHKNSVSYGRLDLPLIENHDWSLQASLAARAIQKVAPAKYWLYTDYIFSNQGSINKGNVETMIRNFVEDHEIDQKKFDAIYRAPAEKKALLEQASRILDSGVYGTPTFVLNGQQIHYMGDNDQLLKDLEAAVKNGK